jgi:hypothetical protein
MCVDKDYNIVNEIQLGSTEITQIVFSRDSNNVIISDMAANLYKGNWE